MALADGQPSVLLENVGKLIRSKVKSQQSKLIEHFAEILYGNISKEDLAHRNDSDLYGAALSLWNNLNSQGLQQEPSVRVFNPELAKHGWKSSHTIIEIIVSDMPFLVDSVRMALSRIGVTSHLLLHSPIGVNRDDNGEVSELYPADDKQQGSKQTVFFIEVDRLNDEKLIDDLASELQRSIRDVSHAVEDWEPISNKLQQIIAEIPKSPYPGDEVTKNETLEFLNWILDHHFTLMGYRCYDLKAIEGDHVLHGQVDSSLGLLKNSKENKPLYFSSLPEMARQVALGDSLLILTKTNSMSRVHRPAYIDYIGIKRFDDKGNVIGEHRFIGLYASRFYNNNPSDIPLVNHKLLRVMTQCGFPQGSHAYKAVLNILETYPRDELIQATEHDLLDVALGVLQMQERDMTRLFMRKDVFGRYVSCMVYVPRERYNTHLRRETQAILQRAFGSESYVEFTTFFSESVLARTHYIVRDCNNEDIDVKAIEQNLIEAAKTWEDRLDAALRESYGESKGKSLSKRYNRAFPRSYMESMLPTVALVDIEKLESLTDDNSLAMLFYRPQEEHASSSLVRLSLYHRGEPIHLSDVLPILENFGLRVVEETPFPIKSSDGHNSWLLDFSMIYPSKEPLNVKECQERFQQAFSDVWYGRLEDDGFNRLVLGANLTGREASIVRAYAKYMRQIGGTFSQKYIETTLAKYPKLAQLIVALFARSFDPIDRSEFHELEKIQDEINHLLDDVANLDDDRIVRCYVDMVNATVRTNYFQKDENGNNKAYTSFKIRPEGIPDMPLPMPKFEIFVYSPRIEGVHLRGGKVARGGLRWSDRREDFRTEILGLVKAQQVKNTVIVPVGAKGGFVCKQTDKATTRDEFFEEGKACYRIFIRGLLDITDNIDHGDIIAPIDVVRLDADDPYLVVAADKGTATFSDIANEISKEYNFWLGDAFASGGSVGYDHKKMGITARGGWESVKRHFREIGIDCQSTDFSCIAIGDMAGDVFGNGMLLSEHTRLVAAFNHMHIFIDPEPDAATGFLERKRLFALPRSSWTDYKKELISAGGGIFERSAKSIKLTPQIKKLIGTTKQRLTPNELIRHLLQSEVDLLWNGGIGTYVKGATETDADVGDRANDVVRINGKQLKAKIFGEGGNLGLTQLGRIEFARNGGRINTDFIDNVGGVDCSDNEVNIKILLNALVTEGDLTGKQRDKLLMDMTQTVSEIVIEDCNRQTQSISITTLNSKAHLKEHIRFIHHLEKTGKLNRELEFLPSEDELADRQLNGQGLARPEVCVLVAYAKMVLKEELLTPEICENPYFRQLLVTAFPQVLQERFESHMDSHPLRAEIISTKLSNQIVNDMGLNFVYRMAEETGASSDEITICYVMAREIFALSDFWSRITDLNNQIPTIVQTEMLYQIRRNIRRATRWFLRHRNKALNIEQTIAYFKPTFEDLVENLDSYLVEEESTQLKSEKQSLVDEGVPSDIANYVASLSTIFSLMDIAEIAEQTEKPLRLVSEMYFTLGAGLDLHWFLEQVTNQPVANHWQALARASYREELDWQQRALTTNVLKYCETDCSVSEILDGWKDDNSQLLTRWQLMLAEFKSSSTHEFAKFSVALRELMLLGKNNEQSS